ncbi:MAG: DNA repair protein RadC [Bacteroidaceae bacterium]|nr:DNA repair protein RadC [Bacteroidaceae bacterium]
MIRKDFQPFNEEPVQKVKEEVEAVEDVATESQQTGQGYTSIKNWAEEDRPREKLMTKGAEALTNAELLAILIGGGTTKKSAVELMQEVLRDCGDTLRGLHHMTLQDLMRYNGIGEAKGLTLIAAAEIGKRRLMEDSRDIQTFRTGAEVLKFMMPLIQDLTHEESWVLLLNNNARLLHLAHLSTGGLSETIVDVRMLLKEALLHDATSFILVHNHPSGNLRPSRYDEELTQRVMRAAQAVNLRMIDHVIVTEGDYYSFSENGKM